MAKNRSRNEGATMSHDAPEVSQWQTEGEI